jgi:hypothetical protein
MPVEPSNSTGLRARYAASSTSITRGPIGTESCVADAVEFVAGWNGGIGFGFIM